MAAPFDLANITLPEILLWLLTYAVVYAVLEQVEIPKQKSARAIISIVAAFLVLMSYPAELIAVLSRMAGEMLLVIIGLLIFLIIIEVTKIKGTTIEHAYGKWIFTIAIVLIGIAIFVSAGGLELLGWKGVFLNIDWNTLLFIAIVAAAIIWMAHESKGEEKGKQPGQP